MLQNNACKQTKYCNKNGKKYLFNVTFVPFVVMCIQWGHWLLIGQRWTRITCMGIFLLLLPCLTVEINEEKTPTKSAIPITVIRFCYPINGNAQYISPSPSPVDGWKQRKDKQRDTNHTLAACFRKCLRTYVFHSRSIWNHIREQQATKTKQKKN